MRYVRDGTVANDGGPVELTFADGAAIYFDAGPDGESLKRVDHPWLDPFTEPPSAENCSFVEKSGKWAVFEIADEPLLNRATQTEVLGTEELVTDEQKVFGLRIRTGDFVIEVFVDSDELYMTVHSS
ncbi:hypothetical protein [Klenkia sp. PcliD-1-E]|uniref:hypothetical protein n=1 Tax=Klenkia sp. PcliD-1-E TaxID=2954492 RepID=UPI002098299C|nr:hypothetical protein [Klenkia sp. PcliD-1-E]MCO7219363.1 hypothetical protein [Klenkia sp. PcliD-1-E]